MNILMLTAMKVETDSLLKFNIEPTNGLDGGFKLTGKNTVFVMETGVGPISAGIRCQKYIDLFNIDLVVLVGLAGGIDSCLSPGDHVVAQRVFQHDAICEYEDKLEYMTPGGLHLSLSPDERKAIFLEADLKISKDLSEFLSARGNNVHLGDVLSGSSFLGKKESKLKLKEHFPEALIVEMESIGVALASKNSNKPFIVVKTVADTIDGRIIECYIDFIKSEREKCVNVVSYFL